MSEKNWRWGLIGLVLLVLLCVNAVQVLTGVPHPEIDRLEALYERDGMDAVKRECPGLQPHREFSCAAWSGIRTPEKGCEDVVDYKIWHPSGSREGEWVLGECTPIEIEDLPV